MDPQLVSFTRELSGRAGHDHLSPSRITLRAALGRWHQFVVRRSEEHTSELQSLMRISYAVFCLKKKNNNHSTIHPVKHHKHHTYNTHQKQTHSYRKSSTRT